MSSQKTRPRRKPHTKSRGGCTECKKRHIKCGEEKPDCRSCIIRHIYCFYPHLKSSSGTRGGSLHGDEPGLSPKGEQQAPPSPSSWLSSVVFTPNTPPHRHGVGDFEMRDLSLSHHWTVHTGRSISQCWSTESPCGVDIFRLGVNHLFVMYGILSVASLHLASREPVDSKEYLETAEMHHKHGIEQVRQLDWESMDTSSDALRAFSTLNLIYTLATCGPLAGLTGDSSPDKLSIGPQWIHEVRATAPKVDMCQYPTSLNEIDNTMDFAAEDDYFVRIRETFSHASDAEVYDSALLLLRRCHSHLSGPRSGHANNTTRCDMDRWYALVDFLCHLSEEYIERLHQRQPPALIILSFFGATLSLLGGSWFIKGWARSIVTTVDSILGSYWAQYTGWCRDIVALQFIEADE